MQFSSAINTYTILNGHFPTGEGARLACQAFVNGFPQWAGAPCNAGGGFYAPPYLLGAYNFGWVTNSMPNAPDPAYYLALYTSCPANTLDEGYRCVILESVTRYFPPDGTHAAGDPQDNGCTTNGTCGNPINPGSGNKMQLEVDYLATDLPNGLRLIRTYNGSLDNTERDVVRSFGKRWTQTFDIGIGSRAIPLPVVPPLAGGGGPAGWIPQHCFARADTHQIVRCEGTGNQLPPAQAPSTGVLRADGKNLKFTKSGQQWFADSHINDRLLPNYDSNGQLLSWTYQVANGDGVERYAANGRLLSISDRAGATQRLTYSSGTTNDTRIARSPSDAPVCSHMQAYAQLIGPPLPEGLLMCVTDQWGRQLQFEYDTKGRIQQMRDPADQIYTYQYDGPSGGCIDPADAANPLCAANNLTQVTYPDNKSKIYWYDEAAQINQGAACPNAQDTAPGFGHLPNQLTGMTDENGVRFASWTYDCDGHATSSEHAGGVEKVQLRYGAPDANGLRQTQVTHWLGDPANPSTTSRTYNFQIMQGVSKNLAIDAPCAECGDSASTSFDANNNPSEVRDWNGNLTRYSYDLNRNLALSVTEAAGSAQERLTSFTWHPLYRLPMSRTEPKRITRYEYDLQGNLLSRTEQATSDVTGKLGLNTSLTGVARRWTYTYNAAGQMSTRTGPRTDIADLTKYDYDVQGNLRQITNALGQVIKLADYNAHGDAGRIEDSNGLVTTLTYYPRRWLKTSSITSGDRIETTMYEYDGAGQLSKVTLPDQSFIHYRYDDAQRLISMDDSVGNRVDYTLDLRSNRIKQQRHDPNGALTRQISRIFNQLNRLQQVTGAAQ